MLVAILVLGSTMLVAAGAEVGIEPVGRLDHPPIREASGLVASRQYPGVFWVQNDSGNAPALFAVRPDGSLIREYTVAAPNIDWEDLAADDEGHLYVGDIGNNGGLLPLRAVYRLDEPDPSRPSTGPLPATPVVVYGYPPEGRFDAEGMVVDGDRLLVIAKRSDGTDATVYALPVDGSGTLLDPDVPRQVATLEGFTEPVTAADLTPDRRRLVVASYRVARVYQRVGDVEWRLVAAIPYRADGVEAIAWDGDDLVLASEGRNVYRIAASTWKAQAAGGPREVPPASRGPDGAGDRPPRDG